MSIKLTYESDKSVSLGDTVLLWGTEREKVRKLLNENFKIADEVIELSQYNNGDTSKNIIRRRDIYEDYNGQENLFFLNFDINDKLNQVELHYGFNISLEGIEIDFTMDVEKVADLITSISDDKKQLSEGEYFFENLKLTIASSEAMGGDGNVLSYFYCSKDVTHLLVNT